ncbi:beta propeller repeat protein [Archangium lipolyticum]|uniref:hypothetical protein n=1 Tax=Archangium lipolyticum TaxID=2970465 RepID=UPI002149D435|nr:hypothetical protein [Archangium lipolyticum]
MRKFLLVLLFSPCFLCIGVSAFAWVQDTLRDQGIGTGTSVWKPLGPRLEHNRPQIWEKIFIGDHSAFYTQSHYPDDSTTLWRITPTGPRRWSSFPGRISSLASTGGVWFGVMALPGPVGRKDEWSSKLIRSRDEGRTWDELGEVPGPLMLLAVSEQEIWGLGREELYVSKDGGRTVTIVSLPGKRNYSKDRLARGPNGTVWLLEPEGLFRISDQGERWTHEVMPGVELLDGSDGILVGRVAGTLAIRHDAPGAPWIPFNFRNHHVEAFAVSGDTIRVITDSMDPFKDGLDVWYHQSEDGGRTWAHMETDVVFNMALHGREWGVGRDIFGQFYGRVPTH